MRHLLLASFVAALLAIGPRAASAQLSADTAALIDRVFAPYNRSDGPGCVVGVDRGGRPLYRRGYGMASLEFGVPLSEASILESGSLAKQFTAGAIIALAVQGKLDLDDPIRKYVPELHDFGTPVTIRQALNHTSGLRDYWMLFWLTGEDQGDHHYTMDRAYAITFRQRALNFPPDSAYLYSGTGYLLLTRIVERVSGMTLEQFSQRTFFEPLGMGHTRWREDWHRVVPGRATAYRKGEEGGFRMAMPFMSVYGTGGLLTTVGDLLRWNEELTRPRVLGRAWSDLMHRRGRLSNGSEITYASGIIVTQYRGEPEISHSGASGGYETYLARWPGRDLSVALMCNLESIGPTTLTRRVADVFLGPAEPAGIRPPASSSGSSPAPAAPAELTGLAGVYYSYELDMEYRITARDGALTVQFGQRPPILLSRAGPDEYGAALMNLNFKFTRRPDRSVSGFVLSARRALNIRFERRSGS